ncbi:bifunctional UDP-N-acetylmuramoyl-tripeptide:D-alanyl-D-alanine ligase/alanine racemase [Soonwooa sp.]|uniref:bifunctional UDP-N-acetylmuramoyl-tripeptide:D-alanyl-D-alanine ligase/alanine racemase n=1 Tax=Soonwooa sp. TaxID=1938592 RepID=UPI0028B1D803|nr:bifunctional UDP-N-acetylmuramoyl-tripeptide:D-alanyl-D-alanine ligase/alanine racemase [Soonwooa sp.]
MKYTTQELAFFTNSELIGNPKQIVKNLAFDSRSIYSSKNTAFIAINSSKNSGEKYIDSAIEKGIEVIIAEKKTSDNPHITWIIVENSLQFLRQLAKFHFENSYIKSIGITGSNGKTILKEWLYQSLWNEYQTVKSPKSFNSQIGLPLSLLQINAKHELGIFEVGISKPKEMALQEEIFHPNIGVLTYIGSAHSSNFENEEELVDEKIELFKHSKTIIYNGDKDLVVNKINNLYSSKKLISFGFKSNNSIRIINDFKNREELVKVKIFEDEIEFRASTRDEATLSNALALISVLKELGFANSKIVEKINSLHAIEMRLEAVEGVRNNLIINDSYNLDLDSLKIAFQFIQEYNKPKKSLILTDFVDSDAHNPNFYKEVIDLVNEQNFEQVYLIGNEISSFAQNVETTVFNFDTTSSFIESKPFEEIDNQIILLKGARKFEVERIKDILELRKHETRLEVNLNALLHNINAHKSLLKPETKMMAMVKANAYGLGSFEISEFLQHHHIDYFGVAVADEGADLRKKGITTPIIVMNPEQHSYRMVIEYNLEPEIYSLRVLELFCKELKKLGITEKYPIHIKLETGMHRLGFKDQEIPQLVDFISNNNVKVQSIFSHLATADMPEEKSYVEFQLENFEKTSNNLINLLGYQPIRHILNSSGILNYTEKQYDMVRIGIGMMGIAYNDEIQKKLQNTVSFKTVISQISDINIGETVGYGRRFKAEKESKIATIPVGYADGIPRSVGNKIGSVSVQNQLVPIVGTVCMDMLMIDVSNVKAKEGDDVVIFSEKPSLMDFARYCNTIPYEVLTSISSRVKRVYIKD